MKPIIIVALVAVGGIGCGRSRSANVQVPETPAISGPDIEVDDLTPTRQVEFEPSVIVAHAHAKTFSDRTM